MSKTFQHIYAAIAIIMFAALIWGCIKDGGNMFGKIQEANMEISELQSQIAILRCQMSQLKP